MSDRNQCTKGSPMPSGDTGQWVHPDAKIVGEDYYGLSGGGDYERCECPHCGLSFRVELPD